MILCGYIMGHLGQNLSADPEAVARIAANLGVAASDPEGMATVMNFAAHSGAWRWCFWIPRPSPSPGPSGWCSSCATRRRRSACPNSKGPKPATAPRKEPPTEKGAEYKAFLMKHVFRNPLIWTLGVANFFRLCRPLLGARLGPSLLSQSKGVSMARRMARGDVRDCWHPRHALRRLGHGPLAEGSGTPHLRLLHGGRRAVHLPVLAAACRRSDLAAVHDALRRRVLHLRTAGPHRNRRSQPGHEKAAATANGLTGLFGYASTLVSGVGLGFVAQHYGWNWAYVGILGMALIGMGVFLLMWGARADGYAAEAETEHR